MLIVLAPVARERKRCPLPVALSLSRALSRARALSAVHSLPALLSLSLFLSVSVCVERGIDSGEMGEHWQTV